MKHTTPQEYHKLGRTPKSVEQDLCYICGHLSSPYGRHTKDGKPVQTCSRSCNQTYEYNESITRGEFCGKSYKSQFRSSALHEGAFK